jgi:hypothetical protein
VQAKINKLAGLKNGGRLSPINLVTFAGTQNGEYKKKTKSSEGTRVGNRKTGSVLLKILQKKNFYLKCLTIVLYSKSL